MQRREATNIASARLEAAKASLALLKAGTWGRDLEVGRAEVAHAEAQVHRVEADLERLTMHAPIDGEILQLNVRAGEYAPVGQLPNPLLVMGDSRTAPRSCGHRRTRGVARAAGREGRSSGAGKQQPAGSA